MDPGWSDASPLPARQVAVVEKLGPLQARITAAPEPVSGLQLIMEVRLHPSEPVLTVRHGFRNLRNETRRICIWSLSAVEHDGMAVTPWKSDKDAIRNCVFYPKSDASEPCLKLAKTGMGVDFRIPSTGITGCYKVGTDSDAGWAAYFWGRQAMLSRVGFNEFAEYPDGGAPITFYNCGTTREAGFCEVEHVSSLMPLAPGKIAWMEQTITLLKTGGVGSVDDNIATVMKAMKRRGE
jgi:hypothetical protein